MPRFVVDIVSQLDLRSLVATCAGKGIKAYHPTLYCSTDAIGIFSSLKIDRATSDSVAFRFIAANIRPDHDPIATFRKRFLAQLTLLFLQILLLAREMGLLKLGEVSLDDTRPGQRNRRKVPYHDRQRASRVCEKEGYGRTCVGVIKQALGFR